MNPSSHLLPPFSLMEELGFRNNWKQSEEEEEEEEGGSANTKSTIFEHRGHQILRSDKTVREKEP